MIIDHVEFNSDRDVASFLTSLNELVHGMKCKVLRVLHNKNHSLFEQGIGYARKSAKDPLYLTQFQQNKLDLDAFLSNMHSLNVHIQIKYVAV